MKSKTARPELLAPAGNLLSGITAFDHGADAVYAGLAKFNARERTENFTDTEMVQLINYAHDNGKKVYVTLNTLIKESEIPELANTVANLATYNPDAVIVQDIGLVYLLRTYFPQLTIHASTQMGIHNSAGLRIAADMGIKRVILERQLTIDEIRMMSANAPVEIEMFIHGALCCSLSGVCLFSSWVSGSSGNRGKCLQLCRRAFHTEKEQKSSFCLSTSDLCLIRQIPELMQLNIASFKIEGRLKKPDYIKRVVSAYRLVMDAEPSRRNEAVTEAEKQLELSSARSFSPGFTSPSAIKSVIVAEKPGVAGIFCAEIIRSVKNGILIKPMRRIHIGDKVRAQDDTGEASKIITVLELRCQNQSVNKVGKGQTCVLVTDEKVPRDSRLYKTGESYREQSAKLAKIPTDPAVTVDLKIQINAAEIAVSVQPPGKTWRHPIDAEPAKKHALSDQAITDLFKATGDQTLKVGAIGVTIDGNLFLPLSSLKQVRRDFWKWFKTEIEEARTDCQPRTNLKKFLDDYGQLTLVPRVENTFPAAVKLPFFCVEPNLSKLKSRISAEYRQGTRRFRITSLYQLDLLRDLPEVEVTTSFPLPVCNVLAICELHRFSRVKQVQLWPELALCDLRNTIEKSTLPVELYQRGRLPLLITRARIPMDGIITDRHGSNYRLYVDPEDGLTYLYAWQVFEIPELTEGVSLFVDHQSISLCPDTDTRDFNLNRGLG